MTDRISDERIEELRLWAERNADSVISRLCSELQERRKGDKDG